MTYSQLPKEILIKLANLAINCTIDYPASDYTIDQNEYPTPIQYTQVLLDNDWREDRVRFFEHSGDIIRVHRHKDEPRRVYNLWQIFALGKHMGLTYDQIERSSVES